MKAGKMVYPSKGLPHPHAKIPLDFIDPLFIGSKFVFPNFYLVFNV